MMLLTPVLFIILLGSLEATDTDLMETSALGIIPVSSGVTDATTSSTTQASTTTRDPFYDDNFSFEDSHFGGHFRDEFPNFVREFESRTRPGRYSTDRSLNDFPFGREPGRGDMMGKTGNSYGHRFAYRIRYPEKEGGKAKMAVKYNLMHNGKSTEDSFSHEFDDDLLDVRRSPSGIQRDSADCDYDHTGKRMGMDHPHFHQDNGQPPQAPPPPPPNPDQSLPLPPETLGTMSGDGKPRYYRSQPQMKVPEWADNNNDDRRDWKSSERNINYPSRNFGPDRSFERPHRFTYLNANAGRGPHSQENNDERPSRLFSVSARRQGGTPDETRPPYVPETRSDGDARFVYQNHEMPDFLRDHANRMLAGTLPTLSALFASLQPPPPQPPQHHMSFHEFPRNKHPFYTTRFVE